MMLGFSPEMAILPGVAGQGSQVLFAMVIVPLLPRIGVQQGFVIGSVFLCVSYLVWGPVSVLIGKPGPFIAHVLLSCSMNLIQTCVPTIVSQRVEEHNQSKCQAGVGACFALG